MSTSAFAQQAQAQAQAQAENGVEECLSAHADAQRLWRSAQLKRARESLFSCSRKTCPTLVRADCTEWLAEVDAAIPSVVVSALAGSVEVFDVALFVDGQLVTKRLDGTPLELDPGIHTFKLQLAPWPDIERRLLIPVGVKQRLLQFNFSPPKPTPESPVTPPVVPMHRPVPLASYVLAGGALLGLAGFVTFAAIGNSEQSDAEDSECRPFCAGVDSIRTKYYIADGSLIFGGLAAAGAIVVYITRPLEPVPVKSTATRAVQARTFVDVQPNASGASVRVGGAF